MLKSHKFKFIRYIACFIISAVIMCALVFMWQENTKAAGYREIKSMDEFYDALSDQIYNHEAVKNYTVNSSHVMDQVMDFRFDKYETHYNSNDPMSSGCYLYYYIERIFLQQYGDTLKVTIIFPYTDREMRDHFAYSKELAQKLVGKTDFETVKNVHDYLIDHYDYDPKKDDGNHTDIEGFRDGVMVCTGYSLATYSILNELGIPTRVVTGYGGSDSTKTENHMWNMVCLDDKWYNLDVTWDDNGGTNKVYTYFLKSDADFTDHTRLNIYSNDGFRSTEKSYKLPWEQRALLIKRIVFYVFAGLLLFGLLTVKRLTKNGNKIV